MTKLATIRTPHGTRAVRIDDDELVDLGFADLRAYLEAGCPPAASDAPTYALEGMDLAPVVPSPSKVICVGSGSAQGHAGPALRRRSADRLVGARDDIVKGEGTHALDGEVELAVVIGTPVSQASEDEAATAIAGFTIMTGVSGHDEPAADGESTPVGPCLVTPDELGGVRPDLRMTTSVDGRVIQQDDTESMLLDPVALVRYVSTVVPLEAGDIVATGTSPADRALDPQRYLVGGETVVTVVEGIGACVNRVTKAS